MFIAPPKRKKFSHVSRNQQTADLPPLDRLRTNRQVAPDMSTQEQWIAAAFGETGLHAWAMRGSDAYAQAFVDGPTATAEPPEGALLLLPDDWLAPGTTRVLACGLNAGPFQSVPVSLATLQPVGSPVPDARRTVLTLPGLKQSTPPDIMQGGETRIAGFLATHDGWDGVICLPGLQTCWAHISAGEVVSFQTFLTGELVSAVSPTPITSLSARMADWDATTFADSLDATLSRPEKLAAALAAARARDILESPLPMQTQTQLWGALIGAELAAARPYWLGQQVAIIGTSATTTLYGAALQRQGVPTVDADPDEMALVGLTAAWQRLP